MPRRSLTVTVAGLVETRDQNDAIVKKATVATTWTLPGGAKQNQIAITDTNGNANFRIKGGSGTYTITVTNIAKAGYTFDAANSVLTKSINK